MMPARLTSDLLARKGDARPSSIDDMAFAPSVAARPAGPVLIGPAVPHAPLVEIFVPGRSSRPAGAGSGHPGRGGEVNLSVRIDRVLHTRLRVLAVRQGRTNQDIVQGALEAYLNVFAAGCGCVADTKSKG